MPKSASTPTRCIVCLLVAALRDKSQENERELKASEFDLNYVALEGNIGLYGERCWFGDGDAMDIIKLKGGQPGELLGRRRRRNQRARD